MSPRVISLAALSLLLGALAARASADEPKVYRWVGRDGRVYTSNAPGPGEDACARYGAEVARWRDARESIESWQATLHRLESRTDGFTRRNDTVYKDSLGRARSRLDEARARASRIESEAHAAGVPQSCLTE
jgi:hypothetical protein